MGHQETDYNIITYIHDVTPITQSAYDDEVICKKFQLKR